MIGETIEITIEKMAGLGDGQAWHNGRQLFVPATLAGDRVRVKIVKETAQEIRAELQELITPGQGRVAAECKHFGVCGSCSLQHMDAQDYRIFKTRIASEALRKAGYDEEIMQPLVSLPTASRGRAELKVRQGKVGYYKASSHEFVAIEECKVLEPALEALLLALQTELAKWPVVNALQVNGVDNGYDIVWSQPKDAPLATLGKLPGSVRRLTLNGKTLYENGPVTLTLGGVAVNVPPGCFLQASKQSIKVMTDFVLDGLQGATNVLDLFAGVGTYAFALAKNAKVIAVEGEAVMVKTMQHAITTAKLQQNMKAQQRDLFQNPFPANQLNAYDAIVINPPRAGAKEQVAQIAQSRIKKVVMISCNPATFARDAKILKDSGFALTNYTPLDQFIYSPHLELLANFTR